MIKSRKRRRKTRTEKRTRRTRRKQREGDGGQGRGGGLVVEEDLGCEAEDAFLQHGDEDLELANVLVVLGDWL
eukprot:740885-Hanusia_phi.AAC.1